MHAWGLQRFVLEEAVEIPDLSQKNILNENKI